MFYSTNHRLNRKLRCWITVSIFWLSSCHIAGAKSQYRRFISRQKNTIEIQIKMWRYKYKKYKAIQADIIKLAGLSESLAGLSDLGSNLPRLTTWVGRVLLNPALYLSFLLVKDSHNYHWCLQCTHLIRLIVVQPNCLPRICVGDKRGHSDKSHHRYKKNTYRNFASIRRTRI